MSAPDFAAIRADLAAASPGPWFWGDAPGAGGTLTFTNSRGSGVDYAEMIVPIQAATVTSGMLAMF